jgi:hypothetical protein
MGYIRRRILLISTSLHIYQFTIYQFNSIFHIYLEQKVRLRVLDKEKKSRIFRARKQGKRSP